MMKKTEQQNQTIEQAEEAAYQTEQTITFTQHLLLGFIISADNEKYTEEQKQEVIKRYDEARETNTYNWEYILQPVDDKGKLAKLFNNGE